MPSKIFVKGARENNLKNIDVEIPRDALTVITGLSGSGKSSLAFDTIYAEGQRRYVESLSSYARMFLGQKEKPDVDYIEGLSPAISIDQKTTSQNPRSTVGTVTEVYDYLRLLWARVGTPHCPNCGKEIRQQSIDQIIDQLMALGEGTRVQIMAPVIRGKKGEHVKIFEDARRSGYVRVRADGNMYDLSEEISLEKNKKHNIEIVIDRLILRPDVVHRLTDSCETAAALSGGIILANILPDDRDILFSQNYACEDCGISIEELTPRMFSFNNPFGACPECTGLGTQLKVDPALVIPNRSVSLLDGAICASGWNNVRGDGISRMYFEALSKKYHFSLRDPVEKLSKEVMDVILYGTKGEKLELQYDQPRGKGVLYQAFEGVIPNLERRYKETQSDGVREELEGCMSECPCPTCGGKRLRRESLAVTVGGLSISDYCEKSVVDALDFVDQLTLTEQQMRIGERILKEIKNRLGFLRSVGLEYLTLSRASASLSGGEAQRIRLATQIGSSLMGVLYILDEPSIGLHQRDNDKLLATLKRLRDLGNTLIVVEHDEDTMRAADYLIDIGPGAGAHGGQVVAADGNPLTELIRRYYPDAKTIASVLPEAHATINPDTVDDARKLIDIDLGVIDGCFGVAENGAVWIRPDLFRLPGGQRSVLFADGLERHQPHLSVCRPAELSECFSGQADHVGGGTHFLVYAGHDLSGHGVVRAAGSIAEPEIEAAGLLACDLFLPRSHVFHHHRSDLQSDLLPCGASGR